MKKTFLIYFDITKVHTLILTSLEKNKYKLDSELLTYKKDDFVNNVTQYIPLNNPQENRYSAKNINQYITNAHADSQIAKNIRELLKENQESYHSLKIVDNVSKSEVNKIIENIFKLCSSNMIEYHSKKQQITMEGYMSDYYKNNWTEDNLMPFVFAFNNVSKFTLDMWSK